MFDRVLRRIRRLARAGLYVMTVHGQEEMEADGLTLPDVERVLLTGRIVERQKDRRKGASVHDRRVKIVTKIGPSGRLVIITIEA